MFWCKVWGVITEHGYVADRRGLCVGLIAAQEQASQPGQDVSARTTPIIAASSRMGSASDTYVSFGTLECTLWYWA